jgi:DNA-binding beta-propeller fold protein YncE
MTRSMPGRNNRSAPARVSLRLEGYIDLPEHIGSGGFDHAAVDHRRRRLYVAHTANDALDVIDLDAGRYLDSIEDLTGVAGALVAEDGALIFTSNRGEDSVGMLSAAEPSVRKVAVGVRPNGLAFDPGRRTLLAANVGDPAVPGSYTASIVDVDRGVLRTAIEVPGRTRWTVFDPRTDSFFVNIADPPSIVRIDAANPTSVASVLEIAAPGPHGLEVDEAGRLYCPCDGARLFVLEPPHYNVIADLPLAGVPDVIFLDRALRELYVAIGDPGLVEVFDVDGLQQVGAVATEPGAHTIGLDHDRHRVYAFLPETHRASVLAAHS